MVRQALFLGGLHLLGVLVASRLLPRIPATFVASSGLLWGLAIWVLVVWLCLLLGVGYTGGVVVGALGATAFLAAALHIRRPTVSRRQAAGMVAATLTQVAIALVAGAYDLTALSYDSYCQLALGSRLAQVGSIGEGVAGELASWGVFIPLVHSAAELLSLDYLSALHPSIAVGFLATFVCLLVRSGRARGLPAAAVAVAAGGAALLLATAPFLVYQAFFVHNSLASAAYLTLGVMALGLARDEREPAWYAVAAVAGFAFTLLRMEAPIPASIFLVLFVSGPGLPARRRLLVSGVYAGFVLLWYGYLFAVTGPGSDILTPARALVVIAAALGAPALVLLSRWRLAAPLLRGAPALILLALVLAALTLTWRDPEHMMRSLGSIASNLFRTGRWGPFWWCAVPLLAASSLLPVAWRERRLATGLVAFVLMVWCLGSFRPPYRLGWGDSANRILTHITPLVIVYLALAYGRGLVLTVAPRRGWMRPARRRFAMVAGALLSLVLGVMYLLPRDWCVEAEVLETPAMSRGHTMEKALRGWDDHRYAASLGPAPATVVLDLGRAVPVASIEAVPYHETEAPEDWAWDVSSDGRAWVTVHDSRALPGGEDPVSGGETTRYAVDVDGRVRYVRLRLRSAKGQSRLLLRRISVYSPPGARLLVALGL